MLELHGGWLMKWGGEGVKMIAVDPGETTGLAWCDTTWLAGGKIDDRFAGTVEYGQIDGTVSQQVWKIFKGTERLNAKILVCESSDHFLLKPKQGALTKHSLVPIKMEGALSFMVHAKNMQVARFNQQAFVTQTPGQAKAVISDEILRAYGFEWAKTKDRHAMDAVRHLVMFIRRYRESARVGSGFAAQFKEVLGT